MEKKTKTHTRSQRTQNRKLELPHYSHLKPERGFFCFVLFFGFVVGFSLTGLQFVAQISERTIGRNESAFVTLAGRPLMIQSGALASA